MSLTSISLSQIATLLTLVVVGFVCGKKKLLDEHSNKKLSQLLLLLINPLVILLSYLRPYRPELLSGLALAILLSAISFVIAIAVAHIVFRNRPGQDNAIEKVASVYSNAGFLGIPLVNSMFGSEGVFYLTGYLTVFFLLFWTHGQLVMGGKREKTSLVKAFASPQIVAVFVGFVLFVLRWELPSSIQTPIALLGQLNTPLAMLVAGASISTANLKKTLGNPRILRVSFVRLVLIPALTFLAFSVTSAPSMIIRTIAVLSACPMAANVIMFAYRFDKDASFASELFAATTILSAATLPLLLLLMEIGGTV